MYISDIASWCKISFGGSSANPLYYANLLYLNGDLVTGDLVIPEGVSSISANTFTGWSGLTSVTIPSYVTSIGSAAFQGCSGLKSVTIPSRVTSIGSSAFYNCRKLSGVYCYPKTPPEIGASAFDGCSLDYISVPYSSVNAYLEKWSAYRRFIIGIKSLD